jgi:hypothetical protein
MLLPFDVHRQDQGQAAAGVQGLDEWAGDTARPFIPPRSSIAPPTSLNLAAPPSPFFSPRSTPCSNRLP